MLLDKCYVNHDPICISILQASTTPNLSKDENNTVGALPSYHIPILENPFLELSDFLSGTLEERKGDGRLRRSSRWGWRR